METNQQPAASICSRAYSVDEVLPHAAPMLLLDDIRYVGEETAGGRAIVTQGRTFTCDDKGLPWWVAVELMAQTIGLWVGVRQREAGEAIRLGFLLGTRKLTANFAWLPIGSEIEIDVSLNVLSADGLAVFDCELTSGNNKASARLNVFQPPDVESYLGIEQ